MSVTRASFVIAILAIVLFGFLRAPQASTINQTANDAIGTSSFTGAGTWSNAAAPSAGNAYTNVDASGSPGYLLRTPATATTSYAFAGDSLTIGGTATAPTLLNQALIFKGSGGSAGSPNVITVNNLILNTYGVIRQGNGESDFFALAGNLLINGGDMQVQGPTYIQSLISGSGQLNIDSPGANDAPRTVHFTNGSNTYTGNIVLNNTTPGGGSTTPSRFELDSTGNLNFVIGANGVNNSITGTTVGSNGNSIATFDGTFDFNLSGADNTVGDLWAIATGGTQTYTSTFTVAGFTGSETSGIWDTIANGVDYEYNQSTGDLTVVPEPASLVLAGLSLIGLIGVARKKK